MCYTVSCKHQPTYLHYMGMKSDMNDVCESEIVLSNSVLDMWIVNTPICLHTLCDYSWHALNVMACRSICEYVTLQHRRHRRVSDQSLLNHTIHCLTQAYVHVCMSCHCLGSLSLGCPCRGLKKIHVKFVLGRVALTQVFLHLLQFSLPVSFHWCFMLIYSSVILISAVGSIIK